jgi:hypothetical protein
VKAWYLTLRFEAAILATGYLVAGWRGVLFALVLREAVGLAARLIP